MAMADRVPLGGEQWSNLPSSLTPQQRANYQNWIESYANQYGVPAQLLLNMGRQESDWNRNTVSSAGARGLMQFMPGTITQLRRDWDWPEFDPANNDQHAIEGAARMLSDIYHQYYGENPNGNWDPVVAGYNAGPNRTVLQSWNPLSMQTLSDIGGKPWSETLPYVRNVTRGLSGPSTWGGSFPEGDLGIGLSNFMRNREGQWVPGGDLNPTAGQYASTFFPLTQTQAGWLPNDPRMTWNPDVGSWGTWGEPNLRFNPLTMSQAGYYSGDPNLGWNETRHSWGTWGNPFGISIAPGDTPAPIGGIADLGNYNPIWQPAGGTWGTPGGVDPNEGIRQQQLGEAQGLFFNPAARNWGNWSGGTGNAVEDYNSWYEDVIGGVTPAPASFMPAGTASSSTIDPGTPGYGAALNPIFAGMYYSQIPTQTDLITRQQQAELYRNLTQPNVSGWDWTGTGNLVPNNPPPLPDRNPSPWGQTPGTVSTGLELY